MAKPINLPNGRSWSTQTAALSHFKVMLARYSDNQVVENISDHDDLVALLERYDAAITDSPAKIGSGIDHFYRRRNVGEGYSTPGFWVHRTDGTDTDFSYIDAVKGQPKRQFHRGAATLHVVSRTRNLAMSAGQRRPKIKRPVQL